MSGTEEEEEEGEDFYNKRMSACCWNKRPHLARLGLPGLRAQAELRLLAGGECACEVAVVVVVAVVAG